MSAKTPPHAAAKKPKPKAAAKTAAKPGKVKRPVAKWNHQNISKLSPNSSVFFGPRREMVAKIIRYLMCPHDCPTDRLPDAYGKRPTNSLSPFLTFTSDWQGTPAGNSIPNDQLPLYLFRNPCRAMIVWGKNAASQPWSYALQFYNEAIGANVSSEALYPDNEEYVLEPVFALPSVLTYKGVGLAGVHGPVQYMGQADSVQHCYLEMGEGVTFQLNIVVPVGEAVKFKMYHWEGPGVYSLEFTVNILAGSSSGVSPVISKRGYYKFTATASVGAIGVNIASITHGSSLGVFCHLASANFHTNYALNTYKVNAGDVLITNRASELYMQGTITGMEVPSGDQWLDYTSFTTVASTRSSRTLQLKTGMHGHLRLRDANDLAFRNYVELEQSGVASAGFSLVEPSPFLALVAKCEADQGRDLQITFTHGLEAQSNDVTRDWTATAYTPFDLMGASAIMSQRPQFVENPLHLQDMLKTAKKALGFGGRLATAIAPAFGEYGPAVMAGGELATGLSEL